MYWVESLQAWAVSRYADVVYVLKNPHLFSSSVFFDQLLGEFNPAPEIPWMITSDPPAHTRLRKLANKGFMPSMIRNLALSQSWPATDQALFFAPGFMPREWQLTSLKSQAEVASPHEFFLRPDLKEGKFPEARLIELSPELRARVQAQEQAGRRVFTGEEIGGPLTTALRKDTKIMLSIENGNPQPPHRRFGLTTRKPVTAMISWDC